MMNIRKTHSPVGLGDVASVEYRQGVALKKLPALLGPPLPANHLQKTSSDVKKKTADASK